MGQFHWDPESYLSLMAQEVPDYGVLQDETAAATRGMDARTILELGTGTGETARRVLAEHRGARDSPAGSTGCAATWPCSSRIAPDPVLFDPEAVEDPLVGAPVAAHAHGQIEVHT